MSRTEAVGPGGRPAAKGLRPEADAPPPLFGRDRARRVLASMLTDDRSGVVTVTGPGAVGKSVLAATVARKVAGAFDDSLMLTEQAAQRTESIRKFLTTVQGGIPTRTHHGPIPRPRSECPPSRRLLVIDPADDLGATIGDLSSPLPPGTQILACAIRPLGLADERTVPLGALPTVDPEEDFQYIAANPAVQLFRSAALEPTRGNDPTPDELRAIASVCRELGGWPLAIEHAAALSRLLPPDALAAMFVQHPEMAFEPVAAPKDPTRLLPSLRAAFDRTWRRLTSPERSLLRTASMFAGPFDVTQAATVAARPMASTIRTLAHLLDLGLVKRSSPDTERFTITAPVRQYARWTFGRKAPERTVKQRYIDLVRETAHTSARASYDGDEVAAVHAIRRVEAEFVPVLDHLLDTGATNEALQLAGDLAPGLVQSGEFDTVVDRLDVLLRRTDITVGPALAGALVGYADIVFTGIHGADRHDLASERLRRGIQLLRDGSDPRALLHALSVMIRAWPVMRDPRVVADCVREGSALARATGSPAWLARFEAWSGMLAHQTGHLATALALGKDALARSRRCGDRRARLLAGLLLHTVPEPPTDIPGGLPDPEELVALAEELHEPRLGSIMLAYLARQSLLAGRLAEASYWSARALETGGSLDTPFGAGFAIMFLVEVARGRGEPDQAVTMHGMVADRLDELAAELPPQVATNYAALVMELRGSLGDVDFNARASAGARLPWREATSAALAYAYRASGPDDQPSADPGPDHVVPDHGTLTAVHDRASAWTAPVLQDPMVALTPREEQVLDLIAEGWETRAIADHLEVSVHAVSHHTSNILGKLGVENRTQAAIWAVHRRYAGRA